MPAITMQLTSGDDPTLHTIEHKSVYESHVTLGVCPNPAGGTVGQYHRSLARSNAIAEGVRLNPLDRNEALMGYSHIWLPSVGYPLACWGLDDIQLHRIEMNPVNAFLPKMGFCSKTSRGIIFGSKRYGGLGLHRLRDFQGVNQVLLFTQHLRLFDSVGRLMHLGYCWYHMYCGTGFALLGQPSTAVLHSPVGFFTTLRTFLSNTGLSITLAPALLRIPIPLRNGDIMLMDAFHTLGWKTSRLKILNYCRLSIRAESLAEICNTEGTSILPSAWQGEPLPSSSTLLWPNQARPASWAIWRKALAELFLHNPSSTHRTATQLPLRARLGRWLPNHSDCRLWPCYQTTPHLFLQSGESFLAHKVTNEGRLPMRLFDSTPYARHSNPQSLDSAVPCSTGPIRRGRYSAIVPLGFYTPEIDNGIDHPNTFTAFMQQLDPWDAHLFPYFQAYQPELALKAFLEDPLSPHLLLAHDGGASDRGSFGWLIATPASILWEGSGLTQGRTPGSFRAESYGMLAALRFLLHYLSYWNVTPANPSLVHLEYTDSKSLLQRLASSKARFYASPKACLASEYDLESAITATLQALPITLHLDHIKAHQDKLQPNTLLLPWEAQLNIVCDRLAGQQLSLCNLETTVLPNPFCNVYLAASHGSITGQLRSSLFEAASTPIITTYLRARYLWNQNTLESIDWDAHSTAVRSLSLPEHRFVVKFIHRILPIGFRLRQRNAHMPAGCPSCDAPVEDDWHWLLCPAHQSWRDKQARLLARRLRSLHTEPGLKFIILRAFRDLTHSGSCSFTGTTLTEPEQSVVNSQATIGWQHFLFGRFSKEWSTAQRLHIVAADQNADKYSGSAWTAQIITHLWRAIHALWGIRNEALHGPSNQATTKRDRIEPLISALYSRQLEIPLADQIMFRKPLNERLRQPLSVLNVWLSVATPAFHAARLDTDNESDDEISIEPPEYLFEDHEPPD
jgi:hypothetical protein